MDNLQPGDVLVNDFYDYTREVQGTMSKIVFTTDSDDDMGRTSTVKKLKRDGWHLKDDTDTTELTLEQVAKKFKIPVDKLRIKE